MNKIIFKLNHLTAMFLLLAVVSLSACEEQTTSNQSTIVQSTNQTATTTKQNFVILALGDSLTEGLGVNQSGNYPAILQKALKERGYDHIKVVNSGLSGETSSGLKARLDWVLQLKPQLTILNIGANDAMRGLPLSLTQNNISEIVTRIEASGSEVILAGMQIYDNLGREYVAGFKDMYPLLADKHQLTMIPFFLEHVAGNPKLNQTDMIHPTTAGYEIIVEQNILPVILPILKAHLTHNP
jgi:acyl-CoA thioesterase-1